MDETNTEVNVDQLLDSVESPSEPRAMSEAPQVQQAPTPQTVQEYDLKVNGKSFKAPIEKIIQWAQMGYEAPNKIGEINKKLQDYESKVNQYKDIESKYKPYETVDAYAKQNPDWWQKVQAQFEAARTNPNMDDPVKQELTTLKQELMGLKEFKESLLNEKQTQKRDSEDKQLKEEIESIRKSYTNLDFDTPDTDGQTLEYKVLRYANERGISNFSDAFRSFNHDRLIKLAEERGKESISKDIQKKTKLGLLGQSSTPKKTLSQAQDIKNKTYEMLLKEALEEASVKQA